MKGSLKLKTLNTGAEHNSYFNLLSASSHWEVQSHIVSFCINFVNGQANDGKILINFL